LTEDEKRLRDALKTQGEAEAQTQARAGQLKIRRPIQVYGGAGPEASRAGRPEPIDRAQHTAVLAKEARLERARQMSDGRRKRNEASQNMSAADGTPRPWNQLNRRVVIQRVGSDNTSKAGIQDGEYHESRGYTSPSPRNPYARQQQQPQFSSHKQISTNKSFSDASASGPTPDPPLTTWRAAPQKVEPELSPAVLRLREEEIERAAELEQRQKLREQRPLQRSAEHSASSRESENLGFKGRGKDKKKDRRREEFATEEDNHVNAVADRKAELKKERKAAKAAKKAAAPTPVLLPEYISVANLATVLKVRLENFVEKMEELGFEETGTDYVLNGETAGLIAQEYNFEPLIDRSESEDLKARPAAEDPSIFSQRAPVVTIMGHVDHGKTTILDYLRKSSVAAGEAGGITQHIGAFSVPMPSGKVITFLDTPGHAAFLNMRQRGANVTDIVILVVAADDSVKPQTIEAINHAKSARVPIIVAINKIDKEDTNIDRVKQDLARHGVDVEDYGGDTQVVCVSGKTGQGMDELEEAALTLSDVLDMRADTKGAAEGWVLEASIKSMGKVATVLVRCGTMRPGDFIVAGKTWARIRCMRNEAGVEITEAGPGTPVEIDGWKEQPLAGDEVLQAPTEQKAKSVVDYRIEKEERDRLAEDMEAINEDRKITNEKRMKEKLELEASKKRTAEENAEHDAQEEVVEEEHGPKQVYFILKGDVSGSVEAVTDSIAAIGNSEIRPVILRSGVGHLSEFDVEHAAVAKGFLISFNNPIDPMIQKKADAAKVKILDHNIIYRLVDDVKGTLSEFLPPIVSHKVLGEAEVAQVFNITVKGRKQKPIAGCKVRNGVMGRNTKVRVFRKGKKVFDGEFDIPGCFIFYLARKLTKYR
jgi:translation initiation factor IF-2